MRIGLSNKDQTQVKDAFSLLGEVFGNICENIFDDKSEEKIKKLEKQIGKLNKQVETLSEEREKLEKNK